MNINDPVYLVISCRDTNDTDLECDLIIDDKHILVDAIERVGLSGLDDAEQRLNDAFPQNTLITTHTPFLNLIMLTVKRQDLEAQLNACGDTVLSKPSDSRVGKAFNWKDKPIIKSQI